MSETTGSEAIVVKEVGTEGTKVDVFTSTGAATDGAGKSANGETADIDALEVDVEEIPRPAATGFQAFLQHANLHNVLQIESLSRTTGVFLVVSQGRRGYLHLSNGELIHAETGGLVGEAAASDILAWGDGEFKSCALPLATSPTIYASLQSLLLRMAKASDEAQSERRPFVAAVARPMEEDKPTEPHLPAPATVEAAKRPSSSPPRSVRPPPLPPRIERESSTVAEVVLSASGDVIQGRGAAPEEFSARVAYAARLADLIGRAIRSGTPRALELRGKGTQTLVKWQTDGNLSATLELVPSAKR